MSQDQKHDDTGCMREKQGLGLTMYLFYEEMKFGEIYFAKIGKSGKNKHNEYIILYETNQLRYIQALYLL